jgi:hypothetical protein
MINIPSDVSPSSSIKDNSNDDLSPAGTSKQFLERGVVVEDSSDARVKSHRYGGR